MKFVIGFLSIILMIILHEFGHFLAARICKVPVYEFSIGMGKKLFSKKCKSRTLFSIRLFPIGGFCAFDDEKNSSFQDSALNKIPIWQKIFICVAGPFVNIFTAFVVIFVLTISFGTQNQSTIVSSIKENYPAYNVLETNDKILSINDISLDNLSVSEALNLSTSDTCTLEILRNEKTILVDIVPVIENNKKVLGINLAPDFKKATFFESVKYSFSQTIYFITSTFQGLFSLITGKSKLSDASGVVGISVLMGEYATLATIYQFFSIVALISANLGVMNLLPIPGLDGSKILFGIIELLRGGKRIPEKIEEKATLIGFSVLIGFIVLIIISDFIKIIGGVL